MATPTSKRPNFLVIVADDLGFSDCSCFGSEIKTPAIDSLVSSGSGGLRFTSFHVAAACSPTRSMLMSGTDHHIAGLGQLAEFVRNSPAHQGQPGHEGYLNDRVVALPELLKDGGYQTFMSGKWHLGLKKEHAPQARGFDKSFALLPGCANHYGWEPQYQDPTNEPPRFFETAVTALHMEDSEYIETLPKDFYSSEFYASKLISYLSDRNASEQEKPFFAYLPFSAPHWPLQAPAEFIAPYKSKYDAGPEALRLQRLARLQELHLVSPDIVPHEIVTSQGEPLEWSSLSPTERAKSARSMETYAGMVSCMDHHIGRVLDHLRSTGEFDNTYIFFMSDNGAEGASYEANPLMGDKVMEHIEKYYDNSLENMGRANSFVWYGVRWAQAATAPSRLYKMFSTQGGCRVPLVVKPAGLPSPKKQAKTVPKDNITDAFCTVMDIVPTILDLACIPRPGRTYHGRPIAPLKGTSWESFFASYADTGVLAADPMAIHGEEQVTGWEVAGSGAIRKGKWKITFVPAPKGPQRWELFDILADPGETRDVRDREPAVFEEMLGLWEEYSKEVGVVGLAGEFGMDGGRGAVRVNGEAVRDEFEDTGRWIRYIGKKNAPVEVLKALKMR